MLRRFHRIPERDGQTDGRTDDASFLSVVSFNSTKRRVESFIVSYVSYSLSLRAVKCAVLAVLLSLA